MEKKKFKVEGIYVVMMLSIVAIVLVGILFTKGLNSTGSKKTSFSIEKYGLEITEISSYTGAYIEDGSDIDTKNIMQITVTNTSDTPIQYCEIVLMDEKNKEARFAISTLPSGESVTVLEKNKREYKDKDSFINASAECVAYFQTPMSMYSDTLKISGLEGALNITNISDCDITGTVYVYYKNYDFENDLFVGGITYRAKIEGGITNGEIKQVMTSHYNPKTSMLMFVTIGE